MNIARAFRMGAVLAGLCLPLAIAIPPLQAAMTVNPSQAGNVFYTNETVSIPVSSTSGVNIGWQVSNYFGEIIKTGTKPVTGGTAVITPGISERGWFLLDLTEKDSGGVVLSTLQTKFSILTPITVGSMASSPFGVQSHFAQFTPTGLFPLMARAGIAHFRDEQYWNSLENPQGTFTFPSKYTGYMSAAGAAGIHPMITLDWSNQHYDWDTSTSSPNPAYTAPYTSTGRAGYANYALQVLNQYPGQIATIEGWNEYNGGTFIKGPATTNRGFYYSQMMQTLWQTVKPSHPNVIILGGASVPVAHGFFKSIFDNGGLAWMDAVSIHPYRATPEGVELEISELDNLVKTYNSGVSKPIWATEFSQSVSAAGQQADGASYTTRIATQMLSAGVTRMYYYLLQDDTHFPYRGLLGKADATKGNYLPNPSYVSYAVLIRELYNWTYQSRVSSGIAKSTYLQHFMSGSNNHKYVCWSLEPTFITFTTTASSATVTDIMGNVTTIKPSGGKFMIGLTQDTAYVKLSGTVTAISEGFNPVVADCIADYAKTQGTNGWTYGQANVGGGAYSPSLFTNLGWNIWKQDNYRWKGSGDYPFLSFGQMHPSGNWVIRRWTSTVAGDVTLSGTLGVGNSSDGVRGRIFVDGVEVYNQLVTANQSLDYSVAPVTLSVGSKVDFAVDRVANQTNDATNFTARVTRIDTAVPSAPSGLTAQAAGDNKIQLNWTDHANNEDGFEIEWKWGTHPYTLAGLAPANSTSFLHGENMAAGRVYTYRIRAFRTSNASAWSNEASSTDG